MKIKVWIVNAAIPNDVDPCFPSVFVTEAEADAYADKMLREEWGNHATEDEAGNALPYPDDWRAADAALHEHLNEGSGSQWGRWEITSHEIGTAPVAGGHDDYLARFPEDQRATAGRAYEDGYVDGIGEIGDAKLAVILDGGLVQSVVATGGLIGLPVTVIDYDVEGAEADRLTNIDQGDGTKTPAWVTTVEITEAGITIPGDGN